MKKSGKRAPQVQYGRSYRYRSTEQAIKDLARKEKEQREAKAKKEAGRAPADEGAGEGAAS